MAYNLLSLRPPKPKLGRVASTVYAPLSRQIAAPQPAPDYNQQITSLMAGNQAPQFAPGTPHAVSTGPFSFTNATSHAFEGVTLPQSHQAQGQAAPGAPSVDFTQDPIYQQAQAAVQAQIAQAQAAAQASEATNLIRYGSGDLLKKVLGGAATQAQIDAANNNQFGTVQELGRWNTRALSGIDTASNRNNLYFSSTRQRDRGLQSEDYVRQQSRTANQLQDVLTGIAQQLIQTEQAGQATLLGAAADAYNRQLQMALAQQYYGSQYGGGATYDPTQAPYGLDYQGNPVNLAGVGYTYQPQPTSQWYQQQYGGY